MSVDREGDTRESIDDKASMNGVVVKETEHARQRRLQRGIDMKMDLQTVLTYGKEIPCLYGRAFKYKDITYIIKRTKTRRGYREDITCYATPIGLKKVKITQERRENYDNAISLLKTNPSFWKSNTVIVADTSGSMKTSDVWGSRTRLHSVWMTVALDFIAHRLESGNGGLYDLVSIVSMGDSAEVLINPTPTSWILYNKVVEMYQGTRQQQVRPFGPGNYIPSLKEAKNILTENKSASCALALIFISDGRPSDQGSNVRQQIMDTVESLAKNFGRRLTFTTVGIGSCEKVQEFNVLKSMADMAKDYGVQASFQFPSTTSAALGDVLTRTATSLTKTQTEMTDLCTLQQRNVRDIRRESSKKASEEMVVAVSEEQYFLYSLDQFSRFVYREWHDDKRKRHYAYDPAPPQNRETKFVALNKEAFGEGAERFAFRFFEIGDDGQTVIGKSLVAKESRLVHEHDERGREAFIHTFCTTQQLARRFAEEFNNKLDGLHRVSDDTPRVTFLDCSVYEIIDSKMGKQRVLVEEKLNNIVWHKWNANNGYIEGMEKVPEFSYDKLRKASDHLTKINLDAIEEEDGDEEEDGGNIPGQNQGACITPKTFSASEVAQAFSHFSYYASGKKRLVCDLQGVFDKKENILKLSDPVIHYFNPRKINRKSVHGRTDLGRKGMYMFFQTHKDCCGHLCRLVTGGFQQRRQYHNAQS